MHICIIFGVLSSRPFPLRHNFNVFWIQTCYRQAIRTNAPHSIFRNYHSLHNVKVFTQGRSFHAKRVNAANTLKKKNKNICVYIGTPCSGTQQNLSQNASLASCSWPGVVSQLGEAYASVLLCVEGLS